MAAFENLLTGSRPQCERENAAPVGIVLDPDLTIVRLHDGLTNRQSQPDTLTGDFLSVFYLVELVKDSFFMTVRDAGSRI